MEEEASAGVGLYGADMVSVVVVRVMVAKAREEQSGVS